MLKLALIFLGGGVGSVLRFTIGGMVQRWGGSTFPLGTLSVNVMGCMVIGFASSLLTGPIMIREEFRLAILVGLLGGFTTFSSYGWESFSLANDGQFGLMALNLLLSNGLGLLAAWGGARLSLILYGA